MTRRQEPAARGGFLRDLFSPFRTPSLAPDRGTTQVIALAQSIYAERGLPDGTLDRGRLAVLADALEEAGCTDRDILGHCRQQGAVHVRGCFVLDLLLGEE